MRTVVEHSANSVASIIDTPNQIINTRWVKSPITKTAQGVIIDLTTHSDVFFNGVYFLDTDPETTCTHAGTATLLKCEKPAEPLTGNGYPQIGEIVYVNGFGYAKVIEISSENH